MLSLLSRLPRPIRETLVPNMRIPPIKNDPTKVQLERLGHVYFEHPDLDKFAEFAMDFGFQVVKRADDIIYLGGYGIDKYIYVASRSRDGKAHFKGPAFVAQSEAEFNKATNLKGATPMDLKDAPGGGKGVTFRRSDDTFFHVVYGQEESQRSNTIPSATHEFQGDFNTPLEKPRKGHFQRYHLGPALIHKIGHFGYVCRDFDSELLWYTSNFNFVPSDILYHWDFSNIDVMTFMHLDLGKRYSDHHVFFLQRAPPEVKKTYLHHTSYEVADFDTQLIGHYFLAKKGWKSIWGVGRHILGSQIFDYWADSSGFKIEHYVDGDLVNEDTPLNREVVGPISIWGPELPKDFGEDGTQQPSS